ncbi:unnamed protein product [Malus baccata var. baccata]
MPFGLKNAGATYQRAMNAIFHDLIGHNMEVYIDDIVVKSKTEEQHLIDLRHTLTRMMIHKLKMNPKKCAFGVRSGNFLGFLVHQRGVEVDKNKARAIMESPSPTNKVQLQRLLGKINFLRRFIANLAGEIQALTPLLKLKDKENFEWGPPHQEAFDGRIRKWILALSEFSFQYVPQRAVKSQTIADFLAEHQESKGEEINIPRSLEVTNVWIPPGEDISGKEEWVQQEIRRVTGLWITHWKLYFDGSYTQKASGAGIVIINPQGVCHYYSFLLDYQGNTNNRAEYEALIIGLEILMDLGTVEVEVFGDSELVINQLNGEFKCRHITMAGYYLVATQLLSFWDFDISVSHVPRGSNLAANEMVQLASEVPIPERKYGVDIEIQRRNLLSILDLERGFSLDIMVLETEVEDWRSPIIHHLKDPSSPTSKKNRQHATKYVLWARNLLRKTPDGLLLKCLGQEKSMRVMAEVHEGVCGAHQAGTKMRWLLRRYGYFWPDMEKDCKSYARGCEECQRHEPLQHVPSVPLNPVIKPWPFRGWAMDFIGQIYPAFSKGHTFIIVATDYSTKWVEASAVKSITSATVKNFIETKILYRFGVPETIVTDRGPSFISKEVEEFANKYKIKMIQSSPYYPQSNGQAESSNKILVNIIKRMVIDSPEKWHEKLGNTLWAYRTSKRAGTGITPYALTFGQDGVLPMKINIQEGKKVVARAYNKKVKMKSFKEGDLVWKTVLPLGAQLRGFGKWSPTWEGPFIISQVLDKGGYYLADLEGNRQKHPINVKFLKKYCPTLWDVRDCYIEEDASQDTPGRGSLDRVITICDGEA